MATIGILRGEFAMGQAQPLFTVPFCHMSPEQFREVGQVSRLIHWWSIEVRAWQLVYSLLTKITWERTLPPFGLLILREQSSDYDT